MSDEVLDIRSTTQSAHVISCAHCGLPVPTSRRTDEDTQFCCSGCEAVWYLLHQCNLEEYYRLRDAFASGPLQPARVSGKKFEYLDDPEYLRKFAEPRTSGGFLVRLYLEGVHCVACSWLIEKVLMEREGARFAQLDLARSVLDVVFNPAECPLSRIAQAVDRLGYTPHPLGDDRGVEAQRRETRRLTARMGIAGACAMNIMLLAVSQYAGDVTGIEPGYSALFRWVSLGLALPAVLYSAFPFYRSAWSGLRRGMLHMDLPISLGILFTFAFSAAATFLGRGEVYFDSVSALIFLLLAGRLLLQRATRWAADAADSLIHLTPKTAHRIEVSRTHDVLLTEIREGDRLRVLPGETVPVDGILDSERASVCETHLTGEPAAIHRHRGESLLAGSVVECAPLDMTATAVGETTRLSRLADLMRSASQRRAPITTLMDRVAGFFVIGVLALAAVTALVWYQIDPSRMLWNVAAVLVVACPCALGLATPVALATAMGRAARRGVLIKGQDGVERLARVRHVILDKTGTLTEGSLSLIESRFVQELADNQRHEIICAVAALERSSGHIISSAFHDIAESTEVTTDIRVVPGAGVEGRVGAHHIAAGSESFIAERVAEIPDELSRWAMNAPIATTLVWVARDGVVVAVFALGDRLRRDAKASVADLQRMGLSVEILSGDRPDAVSAVARELGLPVFRASVSPEEKLIRVEELESRGTSTAMIGDGINDAAALGRASVGVSVAGAAEVARDAADVFLAASRGPSAIVEAVSTSRRAMNIIRANLVVALVYNLVGAALAVGGLVGPLLAAVLMPISSATVLLIASRA